MGLLMTFPENVTLHLKEFLQKTDIDLWTLLEFDKALIKKHPGISIKQAHIKVKNDIDVLEKLYPESERIQNQLKYIRKDMKDKKNIALETLWNRSKTTLDISAIEHYVNEQVLESTSLGLAAEIISQNAKKRAAASSSSCIASSSKKRMTTRQTTSGSSNDGTLEENFKENDNVFVNGKGSSVGTTIKHKALLIHQKYRSCSSSLTNRERKIMVAGLSSVLDLTDKSMESQRSLFTEAEWKRLTNYFNKKYHIVPKSLPKSLDSAWTIVANACKTSVAPGQKYLRKLIADSSLSKENRNILKLMEHCLDLIEDYPDLLVKTSNKQKFTENDYFRIIWSRLFELLFNSSKDVRIKGGESVPVFSTENKAELYPNDNNIIGFKIDARVVVDVGDDENDIVSMEVAKDDQDGKVIKDGGKLLREAKDDLDNLLKLLSKWYNHKDVFSWSFQISGANCHISTIHLASDGLYVQVPQHSFDMPMSASTESLLEFRETLKFLLYIKDHIRQLAARISKHHMKRNDIRQNFGEFRKENTSDDDTDLWTRDTWYTPHRDQGRFSALPAHLFGLHRPKPLLERLLLLADDEEDEDDEREQSLNEVDEFGFQKVDAGWFNLYTEETTETHPLHHIE